MIKVFLVILLFIPLISYAFDKDNMKSDSNYNLPVYALGNNEQVNGLSFIIDQHNISFTGYVSEIKGPLFNFTMSSPEKNVTAFTGEIDFPVEQEILKKNHSLSVQFKYYSRSDLLQSRKLLKAGISLDSEYKNIKNKLEIKAGNLSIEDKIHKLLAQTTPAQSLFGIENDINVCVYNKKKLRANLGVIASCLISTVKNVWDYDNYSLGVHAGGSAELSNKIGTMVRLTGYSYFLNKSKYFFLDEISKSELSVSLNWKPNKNIDIGLFNILENERNEKEQYKITSGIEVSFRNFSTKLILTDIPTEEISHKTISLRKYSKRSGVEIYYAALKSPISGENQDIIGIKLNIGFGRNPLDSNQIDVYLPQFKDNDLSFEEIIGDLDTMQKQIRWCNANIDYKSGTSPYRAPYEVYRDKGGDCDELSDFLSFLATKNGHEAYTLVCYPEMGSGHSVALLANKRGELFVFNNLGVAEKVDCDSTLPLHEKVKKTVIQFGEYFPLNEGELVEVQLHKWEPSSDGYSKPEYVFDPSKYDYRFFNYVSEAKDKTHIKRETGVKALIGDAEF